MVAPISDVEEKMYAMDIHRSIIRSGIKAGLVSHQDTFSHILIPASGNLFIEISPMYGKTDKEPLMVYTDYGVNTESIAEIEIAQMCSYVYKARFTVKYAETSHSQRSLRNVASQVSATGTMLGAIDHEAPSFGEFLQGALYKINRELSIEIYPVSRASRN